MTELTGEVRCGIPNVEITLANNNSITDVHGEFVKGQKRVEVEHNLLQDFPWGSTGAGLRVYLAGNTIVCGWPMKRALERGVMIDSAPNCLGKLGENYEDVLKKLSPQEATTMTNDADTNGDSDTGGSDCEYDLLATARSS